MSLIEPAERLSVRVSILVFARLYDRQLGTSGVEPFGTDVFTRTVMWDQDNVLFGPYY
jgi:hypothetical protein